MAPGDTIAAAASGFGAGLRAIVRLSGPGAHDALERLLGAAAPRRGAHRASLALAGDRDGEVFRLPCLVVVFDEGRSYTGEASCEVQVPGHAALVERLLERVLSMDGVRLAQPGEFTARAYLHGRMGLEQAEGVRGLIASEDASAHAAARALMDGSRGEVYRAMSEEVARLLALVEAGIDFTDQEDVTPISPRELSHALRNVIYAASCFIGPLAEESVEGVVRVVLAGPPNAGKSTLFNRLLGSRRSVVSAAAGTTRDAIAERLDLSAYIGGWWAPAVELVDLAGLDSALAVGGGADAESQAAAAREVERADIIVACDPSGRFAAIDRVRDGATIIRVRTKSDLARGEGADGSVLSVCGLDGSHVGSLGRAIADAAAALSGSKAAALQRVAPRHRAALLEARAGLMRGLARVPEGTSSRVLPEPELIASDLRAALDALGELCGRISPDDVLGRVFSFFCVGK